MGKGVLVHGIRACMALTDMHRRLVAFSLAK